MAAVIHLFVSSVSVIQSSCVQGLLWEFGFCEHPNPQIIGITVTMYCWWYSFAMEVNSLQTKHTAVPSAVSVNTYFRVQSLLNWKFTASAFVFLRVDSDMMSAVTQIQEWNWINSYLMIDSFVWLTILLVFTCCKPAMEIVISKSLNVTNKNICD